MRSKTTGIPIFGRKFLHQSQGHVLFTSLWGTSHKFFTFLFFSDSFRGLRAQKFEHKMPILEQGKCQNNKFWIVKNVQYVCEQTWHRKNYNFARRSCFAAASAKHSEWLQYAIFRRRAHFKTDVASQKESMDSILPLRIFILQGNICRWANRAELGGGPFTRIAYVVNKRPPDSYCLPWSN